MEARTDNGQKVITIAHPEHSSGELKNRTITSFKFYVSALRILTITLAHNKFVISVLFFRENNVLTSP